jgi:hypothetical protein
MPGMGLGRRRRGTSQGDMSQGRDQKVDKGMNQAQGRQMQNETANPTQRLMRAQPPRGWSLVSLAPLMTPAWNPLRRETRRGSRAR